MSSTIPLPPHEQLCNRYCSNEHTHPSTSRQSSPGPLGDRGEAHFTAAGMLSQRNQSDSFRFKRAAFNQSLKSKVGLTATKAAALRINLNVQGCGIVAAPVRSLSRSPFPPPPSFTQSPSPPRCTRSLVRDGQTSPHRTWLIVSRSTRPPLSPSPLTNSFIVGTA